MAKVDMFSQIAYIQVSESAANTLTFNGISLFTNILEQQGMVIHKAEYNIPSNVLQEFDADGDGVQFGLSGSDDLSDVNLDDAEVYDFRKLLRVDLGTAASGVVLPQPVVSDLSTLPGGGRLVPADRVYAWVQGLSLASAATIRVRLYFTIKSLAPADYLELVQTLRVFR